MGRGLDGLGIDDVRGFDSGSGRDLPTPTPGDR